MPIDVQHPASDESDAATMSLETPARGMLRRPVGLVATATHACGTAGGWRDRRREAPAAADAFLFAVLKTVPQQRRRRAAQARSGGEVAARSVQRGEGRRARDDELAARLARDGMRRRSRRENPRRG